MNTHQIPMIRQALREVSAGPPDTCATLEVDGDAHRWIQVVGRTINCAYPHGDEPEGRVQRLRLPPIRAELISWEAGKFATFEVDEMDLDAVAEWIDAYFVRVIGRTDGEYHLDVTFEQH